MSGLIVVSGNNNRLHGVIEGDITASVDAAVEVTGDGNMLDGLVMDLSASVDHAIEIAASAADTLVGAVKVADIVDVPIDDGSTSTRYVAMLAVPFADANDPLSTITGSQPYPWVGGDGCQIIDVRAVVDTAPTGADLIVDVTVGGSSLWTAQANQPTISAGTTDSGRTRPDQNDYPIDVGDIFKVDIDQVGSTVAGSHLTVVVRAVAL